MIAVPVLEQKFRFKLPTNCHMSKSITAALTHAAKILSTSQERKENGDISIDFGLHMNDGPIDDTMSAHSYQKPNSPRVARLVERRRENAQSVSDF